MKLPYSAPAIDVISLHDRLATICISIGGDIDNGSSGNQVDDIEHITIW